MMRMSKYVWLVTRAIYEMIRYEVVIACSGAGSVLKQVSRQSTAMKRTNSESQKMICDAVELATCLHWKPVQCLQRSVCTVRLLRKYGIEAHLAIGYRPSPFFSHAWVEVDGRVVNGSQAYQTRLHLLHML